MKLFVTFLIKSVDKYKIEIGNKDHADNFLYSGVFFFLILSFHLVYLVVQYKIMIHIVMQ